MRSLSLTRLLTGFVLVLTLASCDREAANRRRQSGIWTIKRVGWMYYDTLGTVLRAASETDCGEVAFIDNEPEAGELNADVRFYFDKNTPTRWIATYAGGSPSDFARGTIPLKWVPEAYERRRVIFMKGGTSNIFNNSLIYTLTTDDSNRQEWQIVTSDDRDHVVFREEWTLERVR